MSERIEFDCIRKAIESGEVILPEDGSSGCTVEFNDSTPRLSVNIYDLPTIQCVTCRLFGEREGIVDSDTPPLQIIGNNPLYYKNRIAHSCMTLEKS